MTDKAIAQCEENGGTDCESLVGETFDVGWYMFHTIGGYFHDAAQRDPLLDKCNVKEACNDLPPTPAPRADPAND